MNVNFETSASAAGWKGLVRAPPPPHHGPVTATGKGVWHVACGVFGVGRKA